MSVETASNREAQTKPEALGRKSALSLEFRQFDFDLASKAILRGVAIRWNGDRCGCTYDCSSE